MGCDYDGDLNCKHGNRIGCCLKCSDEKKIKVKIEQAEQMNDKQLGIFHQQLMLCRTIQEVRDLANGCLVLPPNDPRDAIIEELDRKFMEAEID